MKIEIGPEHFERSTITVRSGKIVEVEFRVLASINLPARVEIDDVVVGKASARGGVFVPVSSSPSARVGYVDVHLERVEGDA